MAVVINTVKSVQADGSERTVRVSKEKAAQNRRRILDAAARLFRERGISGVGVDALAEAAGLTYGSLYSQFGSKERLIAEAAEHAFQSFGSKSDEIKDRDLYVAHYLSNEHRDNPGSGCMVASTGCEAPRQSQAVRAAFTEGVKRRIARLTSLSPTHRRGRGEDDALATLAMMAGAMMLARAVDDPALSDRILSACRKNLKRPRRQPTP